jgi:hypothetical protein
MGPRPERIQSAEIADPNELASMPGRPPANRKPITNTTPIDPDAALPTPEEAEMRLAEPGLREVVIDEIPGILHNLGKKTEGILVVTNKRLLFFPFDTILDGDFELGPLDELDDGRYSYVGYTRRVHSVKTESILISKENTVFFYSGDENNHYFVMFDFDNKPHKKFVKAMEAAIPGLTFVEEGLNNEYEPNISLNDPRNPYGYRYNPRHPRGYVVAYTKGLLTRDLHAIDDALDAAKRDGTLPDYWRLAVYGISRQVPPPGVPTIFDSNFEVAFNASKIHF